MAGLTPGPWMVLPLDDELSGSRSSSSSSYYEDGAPPFPEWTCTVVDGQTTRHDVDLRDRAPCTLRGEFALAGARWSWTAALVLDPADRGGVLAPGAARRGRCSSSSRRAAARRPSLRAPDEGSGRLNLRDPTSRRGSQWKLTLPGSHEGSGPPRHTRALLSYTGRPGARHALVATCASCRTRTGVSAPDRARGRGKIRNDPLPGPGVRALGGRGQSPARPRRRRARALAVTDRHAPAWLHVYRWSGGLEPARTLTGWSPALQRAGDPRLLTDPTDARTTGTPRG
jgi:hypothetical protein